MQTENVLPPHYLPIVVRLCGKLEMLDRILPKLKAANHRVRKFFSLFHLESQGLGTWPGLPQPEWPLKDLGLKQQRAKN
jgi:hypothetical protein